MTDETKAAMHKMYKAEDDSEVKEDDKEKVSAEDGHEVPKKTEAARWARIQAARKAEANEVRRVSAIRAQLAKYPGATVKVNGKDVDLMAHAIEAGWSADTAETKAELWQLRAARPGAGVGVPGGLAYSTSRPEVNDAVLEAAVFQAAGHEFKLFDDEFYERTGERGKLPERYKRQLQGELKARYSDQVMQSAHSLFKGRIGLQQLLTRIAAASGYNGPETIRDNDDLGAVAHAAMRPIRAEGASTASIANVLANVMNKFLGQGYLFVERSWAEIAAIRSVKDFKATKTINLFGDFEYKDVGPSGELQNAELKDQAFANQISTSGRIITISRQNIINDDLGALTTVPMLLGRGAGLKLNKMFWTKFLDPGKDEGGSTDFWAATHTITGQSANANYFEGAASNLSSTSLQTAKTTFDKQVDPAGNPLGVDAEILLYPPELDQTAWELLNSNFIIMGGLASTSSASKQPSNNRWVNKYKPVMSRYLSNTAYTGYSTTAWYMLANPGVIPVIEVAFLNGQEMPTVQTAGPDFQFNILGITTRAFLDSGVAMQNFRGGVKSKGTS